MKANLRYFTTIPSTMPILFRHSRWLLCFKVIRRRGRGIIWKAAIKSDGTFAYSAIEIDGSIIRFAPASLQTCRAEARFSAFISEPVIEMSPKTTSEACEGRSRAIEQSAISVGNANLLVIPTPCKSA